MRLRPVLSLAAAVPVLWLPLSAQKEVSPKAKERIQKEVRHELVMLPYLSVRQSGVQGRVMRSRFSGRSSDHR
jgi:hypothetical protein